MDIKHGADPRCPNHDCADCLRARVAALTSEVERLTDEVESASDAIAAMVIERDDGLAYVTANGIPQRMPASIATVVRRALRVKPYQTEVQRLKAEADRLRGELASVREAWEQLRRNIDGYDDLVEAVEQAFAATEKR